MNNELEHSELINNESEDFQTQENIPPPPKKIISRADIRNNVSAVLLQNKLPTAPARPRREGGLYEQVEAHIQRYLQSQVQGRDALASLKVIHGEQPGFSNHVSFDNQGRWKPASDLLFGGSNKKSKYKNSKNSKNSKKTKKTNIKYKKSKKSIRKTKKN